MRYPTMLILLSALCAAGCSETGGELEVRSAEGGLQYFEPHSCATGPFFGVDLWSDDRAVRFARTWDEPSLLFWESRNKAIEAFRVEPEQCYVFEGRLERERGRRMSGSIEVDCESEEGHTVVGALVFEKCAYDSDERTDDDSDD